MLYSKVVLLGKLFNINLRIVMNFIFFFYSYIIFILVIIVCQMLKLLIMFSKKIKTNHLCDGFYEIFLWHLQYVDFIIQNTL